MWFFSAVSFFLLLLALCNNKTALAAFPSDCAVRLHRELGRLTRSLLQGRLHFKQENIATSAFSV